MYLRIWEFCDGYLFLRIGFEDFFFLDMFFGVLIWVGVQSIDWCFQVGCYIGFFWFFFGLLGQCFVYYLGLLLCLGFFFVGFRILEEDCYNCVFD